MNNLISPVSYVLPEGKTRVKLYCLSDLHADAKGCLDWLKSNCVRKDDVSVHTVFICAGDVSSEIKVLRDVFMYLKQHYNDVCFTPGNHDLWRKGTQQCEPEKNGSQALATCSFSKLKEVLACALACEVRTGPLEILPAHSSFHTPVLPKSVNIIPLYSWYHSTWDTESALQHPDFLRAEELLPFDKKWSDFRMCAWSTSFLKDSEDSALLKVSSIQDENCAIAEYFADLNETYLPPRPVKSTVSTQIAENETLLPTTESKNSTNDSNTPDIQGVAESDCIVVTYSHFLPRQELCPEKKFLLEPHMTKVIGSTYLESQIRRVNPQLHIFGHTHIPIEITLENIRYVQWPLGYAREKESSTSEVYSEGPLMVYDSGLEQDELGSFPRGYPIESTCYHSRWSKHYRDNERQTGHSLPDDNLSPWLATKLKDFLTSMGK